MSRYPNVEIKVDNRLLTIILCLMYKLCMFERMSMEDVCSCPNISVCVNVIKRDKEIVCLNNEVYNHLFKV